MTRPLVRGAPSFVLAAVVVYGALLAAAAGLATANGEGLSCRDAERRTVPNRPNGAYPLSLVAAIAVSVIAGAVVAGAVVAGAVVAGAVVASGQIRT